MKRITIGKIGLAAMFGLAAAGCGRETPTETYTISGENFDQRVGDLVRENERHYPTSKELEVHIYSEEVPKRAYPSSGVLPLPRANVREWEDRLEIDLYFPHIE